MANTKLSALPVAALVELTELYMGNNPSSERVTIQDLRAFLLGEATREAVVAATTANGDLATVYENGDALDGITLATGDRILIKDQTAGEDNGLYTVNATGAPTRALDFDVSAEAVPGATVAVLGGTVNGNSWWMHTTTGAITLDTTPLTFAQMAGGAATYIGLTDTPGTFAAQSGKFGRVNAAENAIEFVPEHFKEPVRCATDINGTFTTAFANGQSVDGVSLVTGDRILLKDQTAGEVNGIYIVEASGAPTRADDMDDDPDVPQGMSVSVLQGTINKNTLWQLTTTGAITLDTTVLTFILLGGAGGGTFLSLTDVTPSTYTGQALKSVSVNSAETALEFTVGSTGQPFKGALVKPAADITTADFNTAAASLACDEEIYDIGGWHDNSTNNSRLTVPAGVKRAKFKGAIIIELGTIDDFVTLSIRKNGSVAYDGVTLTRNQDDDTGSQLIISSPTLDVIEGNFFEFFIEIETDASVTVSEIETWFSAEAVESIAPAQIGRGALVHKIADETANYSTQTAIPWDKEAYDTDVIHDTVTLNTRLVVPSGVDSVQLQGTILVTGGTTGEHANLYLTKGGVQTAVGLPSTTVEVTNTTFAMSIASPVLKVVQGEYFELELEIETDASVTLDNDRSWFSMEIIEAILVPGATDKLFHVRQEETDGTDGGTTVTDTWNVRDLNTVLTNEISGASLVSSQVILPAGTYEIEAFGNAFEAAHNRTRLRNITDSSTAVVGISTFLSAPDNVNGIAHMRGRFTITGTKTFEVQHWTSAGVVTFGFGIASNDTDEVEVFADVMIRRVN